jgi:hypothetical protein
MSMAVIMRAAVAAAALTAGAAVATPAAAMPADMPAGSAAVLTPVAIVCGVGGCAPVHVVRVHRPPHGFATQAVPLTAAPGSSAQIAPARK